MSESHTFVIRCRGVILDEGKLLVVKHAHDNSFYALPGGHLEWGEDVLTCIRREIIEELGVPPQIGRLLYINTFTDKHNVQPIEFFFEIVNGKDYRNTEGLVRTHAHELSEVVWVTPKDGAHILPQGFAKDFVAGLVQEAETRYLKG